MQIFLSQLSSFFTSQSIYVFLTFFVYLNAYFVRSILPHDVQKHTFGEVGTWTVVWWPVVSGTGWLFLMHSVVTRC